MLTVSQLFIYPIKSLGGISLSSAEVTDRGLKYDRRWMLVDESNDFISQREFAQLALLQVSLQEDGLLVKHKKNNTQIQIPFEPGGDTLRVQVWGDECKSIEVSATISEWFTRMLGMKCKLVYMPDTSKRRVDTRYVSNKEITSFSDGFPMSIIGQASLDDINSRIEQPVSINRFRPNIVFTGGAAFEEDELTNFAVNNIHFYGVKLLARCVVTTIDQEEATKGKEPLRTLATYRTLNKKVYFGQNLVHEGAGSISVGDVLEVVERKKSRFKQTTS